MSLVTTCPSCGTVFRMVREQLDASGGWVRCGHCMDVFDAKTQLISNDEQAASIDAPPLSFVQDATRQAFWQSTWVRTGLISLCLLFALLLCVQILRAERDRLAVSSPALVAGSNWLCAVWPCKPIARLQIDGWLIDHSDFQKVSNGRFKLSVVLKNNSRSELLIPHLDISLLDANGIVLIRKSIDLSADEAGQVMTAPSGEERRFDLLLAPHVGGGDVTGYRLVLFHP